MVTITEFLPLSFSVCVSACVFLLCLVFYEEMDVALHLVGWQICPVCKMWVKMTLVMLVHTSVCVCARLGVCVSVSWFRNAVSKLTLMTQGSRLQCFSAHFQMVIRPFQSKLTECKETIICMAGHPSTCPGFFSQQPTLSKPFKNLKIFPETNKRRNGVFDLKNLAGGLPLVLCLCDAYFLFHLFFCSISSKTNKKFSKNVYIYKNMAALSYHVHNRWCGKQKTDCKMSRILI